MADPLHSSGSTREMSSARWIREQRYQEIQAAREQAKQRDNDGKRLQSECQEMRQRVEKLALLEADLLRELNGSVHGKTWTYGKTQQAGEVGSDDLPEERSPTVESIGDGNGDLEGSSSRVTSAQGILEGAEGGQVTDEPNGNVERDDESGECVDGGEVHGDAPGELQRSNPGDGWPALEKRQGQQNCSKTSEPAANGAVHGAQDNLQQELSRIQGLAEQEKAVLEEKTQRLELHMAEQQNLYQEIEEEERALEASEMEESLQQSAAVELEMQSLSADMVRLKQLCQDLSNPGTLLLDKEHADTGTEGRVHHRPPGKKSRTVTEGMESVEREGLFATDVLNIESMVDSMRYETKDTPKSRKRHKKLVLAELDRLQGEKEKLEREAKEKLVLLESVAHLARHTDAEKASRRIVRRRSSKSGGTLRQANSSPESVMKSLEDNHEHRPSTGGGQSSLSTSTHSETASEAFVEEHQRRNSFAKAAKRLDFGTAESDVTSSQSVATSYYTIVSEGESQLEPESTTLVEEENEVASTAGTDRTLSGHSSSNQSEAATSGQPNVGEGQRQEAEQTTVQLQKVKEHESSSAQVLAQTQKARDEDGQGVWAMKDAGTDSTLDLEQDQTWCCEEESQLIEVISPSCNGENLSPLEVHQVGDGAGRLEESPPESQMSEVKQKVDGLQGTFWEEEESTSVPDRQVEELCHICTDQGEKLKELSQQVNLLVKQLERQQRLREELELKLEIEYRERLQHQAQISELNQTLQQYTLPWAGETDGITNFIEQQRLLLVDQLKEAEKLRSVAEQRVETLNDQVQELEGVCDIAESVEIVISCKDEACRYGMLTMMQAGMLCLGVLIWLGKLVDFMMGVLLPT